jgi:hypothetical protein
MEIEIPLADTEIPEDAAEDLVGGDPSPGIYSLYLVN